MPPLLVLLRITPVKIIREYKGLRVCPQYIDMSDSIFIIINSIYRYNIFMNIVVCFNLISKIKFYIFSSNRVGIWTVIASITVPIVRGAINIVISKRSVVVFLPTIVVSLPTWKSKNRVLKSKFGSNFQNLSLLLRWQNFHSRKCPSAFDDFRFSRPSSLFLWYGFVAKFKVNVIEISIRKS